MSNIIIYPLGDFKMKDIFGNVLNFGDTVAMQIYNMTEFTIGKVIEAKRPRKGRLLIEYESVFSDGPEYVFKRPTQVVKQC